MAQFSYMPVLKAHAAEIKAVGRLAGRLCQEILPMFELTAPNEGESLEKAANRMIKHMANWLRARHIALDLLPIEPEETIGDRPATAAIYRRLHDAGVKISPVLHLQSEAPHWVVAGRHAVESGTELVVRLEIEDIQDKEEAIIALRELLHLAGVEWQRTRILIDCRYVGDSTSLGIADLGGVVSRFIDYCVTTATAHDIAVVGSSVPRTVTSVPKDGAMSIERMELLTYLNVANSLPEVSLAFGDYAIVHPDFTIKGPATHANAKIRYTRGRHQHIFRGHALSEGLKYKQYHELSQRVVSSSEYLGATYSYGDNYLNLCAKMEVGCGNLAKWVEVDTSHHITYVCDRLPRMIHAARRRSAIPVILETLA